jgi:hypothetical protein
MPTSIPHLWQRHTVGQKEVQKTLIISIICSCKLTLNVRLASSYIGGGFFGCQFHKHHAEENNCTGGKLTKRHNCCTEEADIAVEATVGDSVCMEFSDDANMDLPEGLLYGGHHRDDMHSKSCTHSNQSDKPSPHEILLALVETKNLK